MDNDRINAVKRIPLWVSAKWRRELSSDAVTLLRGHDVLIWSGEYNAYWGPDHAGYYDFDGAGWYPFEEAFGVTARCGPEKMIAYEIVPFRQTSSWQPIATAPRSGFDASRHYVLVRGQSRMDDELFIVKAYHDAEYYPRDPWRGIDNDALSDFGWEPTEWMKVPE
jgi:hypothetical protein